jgi:hypothetical protein
MEAQTRQVVSNGKAHSVQNAAPPRLSFPHFGHFITTAFDDGGVEFGAPAFRTIIPLAL